MDFGGDAREKHHQFRAVVKASVQRLNMPKLLYVDGRDLLTSVSGLGADLLHPAPQGMEEIAMRLAAVIRAHQPLRTRIIRRDQVT